jgi:hypothetical protein
MDFFEILGLIYTLAICYSIAFYIKYKNRHLSHFKYYIPGLTVKIIGGISFLLIYMYYFGYGDTFTYWEDSNKLKELILQKPKIGLELFLTPFATYHTEAGMNASHIYYYNLSDSSWNMVKIAAVVNLLGLGNFFSATVLISFFSFFGVWKLFEVFINLFPGIENKIAYAILFVPSVFFWGSGLLKDTVVIGALGYFIYGCFLISKNTFNIKAYLFIFISGFLIFHIKQYVLVALIPATLIWIILIQKEKIKNKNIKKVIAPLLFLLAILSTSLFLYLMQDYFSEYTLDNSLATAKILQANHFHEDGKSEGTGSGYTLGDYDSDWASLFQIFPAAVNVTFFRPYLWEIKSPIMLLAAIESVVIFIIFIKTFFFYRNPFKVISHIFKDPNILMAFTFSIIFAFSVGFTSYNFGALVRYKIPCIPFFIVFLFALDYRISRKFK